MSEHERRDIELSEVIGFILSNQAYTRARFNVIMQTLARILAQLEERDEAEILEELRADYEQEREVQSSELKDYLRSPGPSNG
jgi:hypothetical protein